MESTLEYLVNKHTTLVDDYRTPDGEFTESCGNIAIEVAKRLVVEGKLPYIVKIRGKVIENSFDRKVIIPFDREIITPKPYEGRIRWSAHQICCAEGMAYDPMLSDKPVLIEQYCQKAFEGEVDMDVLVPEDKIIEFLEK